MRFSDWLTNEARYRGFQRKFRSDFPDMPRYVSNQLYQNKIGVDFHRKLKAPPVSVNSPDAVSATAPTILFQPNRSPLATHYTLHDEKPISSIRWNPKPLIIQVSPLDFDEHTLRLFMLWRFGFDPKDNAVRNDTQRFAIQRKILQNRTGDNEPVIVLKTGDKYKLIEGFHRTMTMLLSPDNDEIGAPPDQVEMIKNNLIDRLNLNMWRKVPIKAYVGERTS